MWTCHSKLYVPATDCDCDLTIEAIEDIVFKSDISIGDGFKFSSKIMETFKQQGIKIQETAKECIKTNLQYNLMMWANDESANMGSSWGFFQHYIQNALDDNKLEFFEMV